MNVINQSVRLTEKIESFETSECFVSIYKTDLECLGEEIQVLTSVHKNNGKLLVRFGNPAQIACIKRTYRVINR